MQMVTTDVETLINERSLTFTQHEKKQLENLDQFSTDALGWLMLEHYQFSYRNVQFLTDAAEKASAFDTDAVNKELLRNCAEENGHAPMYKRALSKVGYDADKREAFLSTDQFLDIMGERILKDDPSSVLGALFATETAAIFEHEVFIAISKEIIKRRKIGKEGDPLIYFHQMHLDGVEQAHADELGIFLRGLQSNQTVALKEGARPTINPKLALDGAERVIVLMETWWENLFSELRTRSTASVVA